MNKKIKLSCVIFVSIILIAVSCGDQSNDYEETENVVTTQEIYENVEFLDDEPLNILYMYNYYWGVGIHAGDNMYANHVTLSNLCKEKLGFPLNFIQVRQEQNGNNSYATAIRSGQKADLIFPTMIVGGVLENSSRHYWLDSYIEEGLYLDLTPYMERFCPQMVINHERYPYLKDMYMKEGKIYALYAGMPQITTTALIAKNELLEEVDVSIEKINTFDALYEFMDRLYQGREPESDKNKIMVHPATLTKYSIYNSGYYPLRQHYEDIVFKLNDERCIPYPLERTEILEHLTDQFSRFFVHSYFTPEPYYYDSYEDFDLCLIPRSLHIIKWFSEYCHNETDNYYKKHSIVLFEDIKPVIDDVDTLRPIIVPATSTQPEKAMIFMQWVMTDKEAADILTFGSQLLSTNHYRYASDGTIIPEKYNTIYGFCHMIANFSDKAFLCGNKDFDLINQYRELTYTAEYPIFYKKLDAQHSHYRLLENFHDIPTIGLSMTRTSYLDNRIKEWMNNPYDSFNLELITSEMYGKVDMKRYMTRCEEFVKSILESGDIIYGN
mgnify:FL=1